MEAKKSQIRKDILQSSFDAGACHIGSALSCVDILVDLFYVKGVKSEQFIFSKASGVSAYYAILADFGYFPREELAEYLKNYPLPSKEVPGIIHSMGSLGHGLSIACGIALADRSKDIYVLLSDGECQEGSTMEAVLFARQHNLTNLYVIVDYNKLQACGETKYILDMGTVLAFFNNSLPNCNITYTKKGDGVDFMENNNDWHYRNLTPELLEKALCQI